MSAESDQISDVFDSHVLESRRVHFVDVIDHRECPHLASRCVVDALLLNFSRDLYFTL